ncbi:hypothetical Protein YC6258_00369 [Gynuella sunshinyii YC6258]|uniref:Uncharacterized protein n=1 Tax=Gynuella sunshinyii YC6258 TaxID=1445510 RepID=A0A0C5VQ63_9GAMM|nr:hypothetical Protein YC6258_00369 [Gynuella sunshinyii YC6258]
MLGGFKGKVDVFAVTGQFHLYDPSLVLVFILARRTLLIPG